jgi:branched-chain amino acid transport system substrate-binding protein
MLHPKDWLRSRRWAAMTTAIVLAVGVAVPAVPFAIAQEPTGKLAVVMSLTGPGQFGGQPLLDAVRLAVEEANAGGRGPRIEMVEYDDRSTADGAREAARQAGAGPALAVVGPASSALSLVACPIYAEARIAGIVGTAHEDTLTQNATTFRPVFSTSEMGDALANYLGRVLGGKRAIVLFRDNSYGRQIAAGFRSVAERIGVTVASHGFDSKAEMQEAARLAAADSERPAIVLGMTYDDAVPMLIALRRLGVAGTVLGTATMARAGFADLFRDQPEYGRDYGFFTDGVYALSAAILDSANAETVAFAERYRARYGREPSWEAIQSYDSARLAAAGIRAALTTAAGDLKGRREAVRAYLASLDSPAHAVDGLTGPLWFTPDRGRQQPVRVGRYHGSLFESAPVQLVPVTNADADEIAAGTVTDVGGGRFVRRQRVVYTGIFLNEIPRIDVAQSTFTADLYLWMRFARGVQGDDTDPTQIEFPDLVRGTFDPKRPALARDFDDGTTYRLWRMRGEFKNDFDLHRYPLDQQTLTLGFFNRRAASDRVVYVQDRRSSAAPQLPIATGAKASLGGAAFAAEVQKPLLGSNVAPAALRNLAQWDPLHVSQQRDILVTKSALGDPRLAGVERIRELSGYSVIVQLHRRLAPTLAKTLLPLGLMMLIVYASLYFPQALVKEKVTVAVTAVLAGTVLLAAINAQLGSVGYVIAVEYVFYAFFALCLLCVLLIVAAEQFRHAKRPQAAMVVERGGRYLYLAGVAATGVMAWLAYSRW